MRLSRRLDDPVIPVRNALQMLQIAAGEGIDTAAIRRDLQLPDLDRPDTRLTPRQEIMLLKALLDAGLPPWITLSPRADFSVEDYGVLGYAMMSCATLRQAIGFAMRYYSTAGPLFELSFVEDMDTAVIQADDVLDLREVLPLVIQGLFSGFPDLLKQLLGRPAPPRAVHLSYPEPDWGDRYRQLFGCEVLFDMPACQYRFDRAMLDLPLIRADTASMQMFEESCRELLRELEGSTTLASRISQILLSSPGELPTTDQMALRLNMGPRTLRRHLAQQGTTYQQILDDVRRRLALDYLQTTDLSTQEIAELLGYSEATNFRGRDKELSPLTS